MITSKEYKWDTSRDSITDFCFEDNSVECGTVTLERMFSGDIMWIWSVEIFKTFRGKGLSNKLMQDVLEYIKVTFPEINCVKLWVRTENEIAQKTYLKAGFSFTDRVSRGKDGEVFRQEMSINP
jgi:RimJ/RimL family protein N-acetyltransferase